VDNITSLSLSADSRYITVNLSSQEIHLWDLKKKVLVQHYRGHKQGRFVIRSCFGGANQAFVASGSEGQTSSSRFSIFNATLTHLPYLSDHNVYLWHKLHGTLLEVLEGHLSTVNATTWSPTDPCLLASASDDHTIRLWGPASSSSSSVPSSPNGAMEVTFSNGGSC
jgi:WD40 repeat protein